MKKKKIFITGAYGLLGTLLCKTIDKKKYKIYKHGKKKNREEHFDLGEYKSLNKNLKRINPSIIINLLALTNIEECEINFQNALKINTFYLYNFRKYLKNKKNIKFIHISTDQVYSGVGPHREEFTNPVNNYGLTKYFGEKIINTKKAIILRTNFVGKSEKLNRVSLSDWFVNSCKNKKSITLYDNIYFNPLEINYLAKIITKIMNKKIYGVYNLGSKGWMSKSDFLLSLAKKLRLNIKNCKIKKYEFSEKNKVMRPQNMVMNCKKFENKFKINLPRIKNQVSLISKYYI